MSLKQCPSCGAMISDEATTCPKCGAASGESVTVKCKDCNTDYPANLASCPNCGCPNSSASQAAVHTPATGQDDIPEKRKKRVQSFLSENRQKLPRNRFNSIREVLLKLDDEQWNSVEYIVFKDPTIMLIISIFIGAFGIDRFILGDTTNGIFKLLLTLCCGVGVVWWIIDLVKINDMTLEYNYKTLKESLAFV